MNASVAAHITGMTIFNETQHPREVTGKFVEKAHNEPEVRLTPSNSIDGDVRSVLDAAITSWATAPDEPSRVAAVETVDRAAVAVIEDLIPGDIAYVVVLEHPHGDESLWVTPFAVGHDAETVDLADYPDGLFDELEEVSGCIQTIPGDVPGLEVHPDSTDAEPMYLIRGRN